MHPPHVRLTYPSQRGLLLYAEMYLGMLDGCWWWYRGGGLCIYRAMLLLQDSSHVQRCWRGVQCDVNDILTYRGNFALLTNLQPREVYNGLMHFNTNLSVQCRRD